MNFTLVIVKNLVVNVKSKYINYETNVYFNFKTLV